MRKILILLAMVMGISIVGAAQESPTKVEREGDCFFVVKDTTAKKQSTPKEPVFTGFYTKDAKGIKREVYQGSRGGLYFLNDKGNKVYDIDPDVKDRIRKAMAERKGGTK